MIKQTWLQKILKFLKLYLWQRWRIPHGNYCYKIISIAKDPSVIISEKDPVVIVTKDCPYWSCKDNWADKACGYCYLLKRGDMDINTDETMILTETKTGEKWNAREMPFGISLLWDRCKECGIRMKCKKYRKSRK